MPPTQQHECFVRATYTIASRNGTRAGLILPQAVTDRRLMMEITNRAIAARPACLITGNGRAAQRGRSRRSEDEREIPVAAALFQPVSRVDTVFDREERVIAGQIGSSRVRAVEECDELDGVRLVGAQLAEKIVLDYAGGDDILQHVNLPGADVGEAEKVDFDGVGCLIVDDVADDLDEPVADISRNYAKKIGQQQRRTLQNSEKEDFGGAGILSNVAGDFIDPRGDLLRREDRTDLRGRFQHPRPPSTFRTTGRRRLP